MEQQASEEPAVLVVDDEALIAMHVASAVEDAGLRLAGVAGSAREALKIAASTPPRAAVVDIRLGSGPDGITLAAQLRALHDTSIIFLSGSREPETMARAREVEGSFFMQKPADLDVLVGRLRAMLKEEGRASGFE